MFRRIAKQMHAHRERIVSLMLMPAFLIGTMPHTACICADGHREVVCPAMAGRFTLQCSNAGARSERSCCSEKVGCCSKASCCRGRQSRPPASGLFAKTGSCCHPIVEAPAPVAPTSKGDVATTSALAATAQSPPSILLANDFPRAYQQVAHSTPPPLDVVIVYLRLTI
jgi:hypothetical protein